MIKVGINLGVYNLALSKGAIKLPKEVFSSVCKALSV